MVPPCSNRVTRAPSYSFSSTMPFRVRGFHPLWRVFPEHFHYNIINLRAGPVSLAATQGISIDFCSSGYLDVSVPRVRLLQLCIHCRILAKSKWVSPFGNLRIKVCLPTPRSLSQAATSFIAFCRQGIHHVRLVTWSYNLKHSRVLNYMSDPYIYILR
jgi:hypothetical protein